MLRKVQVKNGVLQGLVGKDPRITVFRGVPYAKPPVGELRWRAPQPAENWEGIRTVSYTHLDVYKRQVSDSDPAFQAHAFNGGAVFRTGLLE